ncbi:hypothetical protein OROHE_007534 [Orobanche hederae]
MSMNTSSANPTPFQAQTNTTNTNPTSKTTSPAMGTLKNNRKFTPFEGAKNGADDAISQVIYRDSKSAAYGCPAGSLLRKKGPLVASAVPGYSSMRPTALATGGRVLSQLVPNPFLTLLLGILSLKKVGLHRLFTLQSYVFLW